MAESQCTHPDVPNAGAGHGFRGEPPHRRPSTSSLSPCPLGLPSCVARQHMLLVTESAVWSSIRPSPYRRPLCRPAAAAKPETRIARLGRRERAEGVKLYLYSWNGRQPTVECSALYSDPGTLCRVAMGGDHGESHQALLGEWFCGRRDPGKTSWASFSL